jgi:hypothetical protein
MFYSVKEGDIAKFKEHYYPGHKDTISCLISAAASNGIEFMQMMEDEVIINIGYLYLTACRNNAQKSIEYLNNFVKLTAYPNVNLNECLLVCMTWSNYILAANLIDYFDYPFMYDIISTSNWAALLNAGCRKLLNNYRSKRYVEQNNKKIQIVSNWMVDDIAILIVEYSGFSEN